jgi:hypothetical protein
MCGSAAGDGNELADRRCSLKAACLTTGCCHLDVGDDAVEATSKGESARTPAHP